MDDKLILILSAVGGAVYLWLKWLQVRGADRLRLGEEQRAVVDDLVQAAEQLYRSQPGQDRLQYVMTALKARYPGLPLQFMRQMIEAAVFRMNNSGAVVTITEPVDDSGTGERSARWN